MKIVACSVFAYRLPLKSHLDLDYREGWLVRLRAADGAEGWGDVAPLPGFSGEDAATAGCQLLEHAPSLPSALDRSDLCSSVRFGLESAMAALSPSSAVRPCRLNALVSGPVETCMQDAYRAVQSGFTAIKLKVGRDPVAQDIERIRQVSSVLPSSVLLRLDANQAWSLPTALEVARGIAGIPFSYIEEPLADPTQLPELYAKTRWPLALDESLQPNSPLSQSPNLLVLPGLAACVLKPMLIGGWASTIDWMRRAREAGVQAVISSSFESGVGIRALAELAARQPEVPAGLDTYRALAADVLEPRLDMSGGLLDLEVARRSRVNTDNLTQLL